ncbi:hypothetical protein CDAR_474251 [Caerostris darwini]|uniref:Uncharacterized protein n=1 Tax=Caerostris darwini TaxID=1538125 RepID=A0AAV4SMC3_9ARAC|nr:hypothetical protein CDAR_474251 [Caerostris darwini]
MAIHLLSGVYISERLPQVGLTTPPVKNLLVRNLKGEEHKWGRISPRRKKNDLLIGTWNMSALYRGGALNNWIDVFENYKLDILAIQGSDGSVRDFWIKM